MWRCKNCKKKNEDNFDICWNCQYDREGLPPEESEELDEVAYVEAPTSTSSPSTKYPALRTIAGLYRILAFITGGLAIISALVLFISDEFYLAAMGVLVIGASLTITLLAVAEAIQVLIDIETNTRQTQS
jgi:hypothetical protein